jgi:hypothetical protein
MKFGPWHCHDCGRAFKGTVNAPDDVNLELSDEQQVRTLVLLKLEPQDKPVFFVVNHLRFPLAQSDFTEDESARYFFEEHSCPTNFIPCTRIISEGDTDPHGLFSYVAQVDRPADLDSTREDGESYWKPHFPQPFTEE